MPKAEAASGINKQINFQGKLVDNNGLNVADSTYTVVFSLYNVSSGGSATWTESDSVTTKNGVFQVALGAVTAFPGNVDFNSDTWYLGIKVGSDAEMTPRVRFAAVPYAFNAAALDGIVATNSASQFTITGGTNALIDLTVTGSLTLGSTIKPTAAGTLTVQSNGANGLTLDTGGAATLAIGATANAITFGATNNPTYAFNGNGSVTFQGTSFTLGNGSTATIQTSSNAGLSLLSAGSGNITLGQATGNGTVVVQPNAGGQAALIIKDQGSGDLLTASAGATPKFTISSAGAASEAGSLTFDTTGVISTTKAQTLTLGDTKTGNIALGTDATARTITIGNTTSGSTLTLTAGSGNINFYSTSNNLTSAGALTLAGSISSAGLTSTGAVAVNSSSGITSNQSTLVINAGGTVDVQDTLNADNITTDTGGVSIASGQSYTGAGAVTVSSGGSNTALTLLSNGSGNVILGQSTGTGTVVVQPNGGGQASLIINNQGSGDIFTASQGAKPVFTIARASGTAVNGFSFTGSATNTAVAEAATGTDSNIGLTIDGKGTGTITINGTATGVTTIGHGLTLTSGTTLTVTGDTITGAPTWGSNQAITLSTASQPNVTSLGTLTGLTVSGTAGITSTSSTAFTVASSGSNYGLQVDESATSAVTGLKISAAATGETTALTVLDSGSNSSLSLDAKGTGSITIGGTSSGGVTLGGNNGVGNVLIAPNAGGQAALIVKDQGLGDLFTASAGATTKFLITNAGTAVFGSGLTSNDALSQSAVTIKQNGLGNSVLAIIQNGSGDLFTASAGATTRFVIRNGGSVGIGTTAPGGTLDVVSTTAQTAALVGISRFEAASLGTTGSGFGGLIQLLLQNSSGSQVGSADIGSMWTDAGTTQGALVFRTSNSGSSNERVRITSTGGVLFEGDTISATSSASLSNDGSGAVENVLGDEGSMVPNAGFEATSFGSSLADGWTVAASSSATITRDTSTRAKGNASAKFTMNANQSGAIYSSCMPLDLNNNLAAGGYNLNWYQLGSAANTTVIRGYLDAYSSLANCQTNTTVAISAAQGSATTTSWAIAGSGTTAIKNLSSSAVWGRVHLFVACLGSCSSGTTVNIDGVRVIETSLGSGVDYAENYPAISQDIPGPGDVVSLTVENGIAKIKKADLAQDSAALGVVSTNPAEVLDDGNIPDPKVPIALSGRIPTKVSTANGPIHGGDYLTTSTIPGVAVKAITAGPVIGNAMEDDTDSNPNDITQITMFVKNSYYGGVPSGTTGHDTTITFDGQHQLVIGATGSNTPVLTVDAHGNLNVAGVVSAQSLQTSDGHNVSDTLAGLVSLQASLSARMDSLENNQATHSAFATDPIFNSLSINTLATVSGNFRVKGDGLFEGMVHVVGDLLTNTLIVNGVSEFFDNAVFHKNVSIQGHVNVLGDSAGSVIVHKGEKKVSVTFSKPYIMSPVITASLTLDESSATDAALVETSFFSQGYTYVITDQSTGGFSIVLNKPAATDVTFTWTALGQDGVSPTP